MYTRKGIVESTKDSWAWVVTRRGGACAHCGHKDHCQMIEGMDRLMVRVKNSAGAEEGDEVELFLSTRTKLKGLFILYIFPVLGLLVGAFSASSVSAVLGLTETIGLGLFTVLGLILALLLARFFAGRMAARQELTPSVVRVVRRSDKASPLVHRHATGCECG